MSKHTVHIILGYLVAGFLAHLYDMHRASAGKSHFQGLITKNMGSTATLAEGIILWPVALGFDFLGK